MEDENVAISLSLIIIASAALRIRRDRRRPRQWTRAWIHRRRQLRAHHALMKELESEDPQSYRNFIRMDKQDFDELLTKVTPFIQRRAYEPFNLLFGEINCIFCRHFVGVLLFFITSNNY